MHIFQGLDGRVPTGDPIPWMTPVDFYTFIEWLGDRPKFVRG